MFASRLPLRYSNSCNACMHSQLGFSYLDHVTHSNWHQSFAAHVCNWIQTERVGDVNSTIVPLTLWSANHWCRWHICKSGSRESDYLPFSHLLLIYVTSSVLRMLGCQAKSVKETYHWTYTMKYMNVTCHYKWYIHNAWVVFLMYYTCNSYACYTCVRHL